MSNVTLNDLIAHHKAGVANCEAYARTNDADKSNRKHYEKRAEWHRDCVELLEGCVALVEVAAKPPCDCGGCGLVMADDGESRKCPGCNPY